MEQYVQRHKIDDHLKRYDSALLNLSLAGNELFYFLRGDISQPILGSDHFDEAVSYIERYSLYETALSIWKDTPRYQACIFRPLYTLASDPLIRRYCRFTGIGSSNDESSAKQPQVCILLSIQRLD